MAHPALILVSRLKVQGFIVSEHMSLWPAALKELGGLVAEGKLKYRETVATGLANGVERLLPQLSGRVHAKAIRVPTLNVSAIDLVVNLQRDASTADVNALLKARQPWNHNPAT